jgi:hypothetical protein
MLLVPMEGSGTPISRFTDLARPRCSANAPEVCVARSRRMWFSRAQDHHINSVGTQGGRTRVLEGIAAHVLEGIPGSLRRLVVYGMCLADDEHVETSCASGGDPGRRQQKGHPGTPTPPASTSPPQSARARVGPAHKDVDLRRPANTAAGPAQTGPPSPPNSPPPPTLAEPLIPLGM